MVFIFYIFIYILYKKSLNTLIFNKYFIKIKYIYHPETNAIEEFFSQLKHYIKKESPNTYDDIHKVIKDTILTKIKKEHLKNYLKHSFKVYK